MFKQNIKASKLEEGNIIQVGSKLIVTKEVEEFYTKNPFPNYEDSESILDLSAKIDANIFMSNLKEHFAFGKRTDARGGHVGPSGGARRPSAQ